MLDYRRNNDSRGVRTTLVVFRIQPISLFELSRESILVVDELIEVVSSVDLGRRSHSAKEMA